MAKAQIKELFFRDKTLQLPFLGGKKLTLKESSIRKLMTALAGLFILFLAVALYNQLATNRQQNFTEENRWTLMNAERVSKNIKLKAANTGGKVEFNQTMFERMVPVDATEHKRVYILLDGNGRIKASVPKHETWNNLDIATLMGPDFVTQTVVNGNEMLPTELANGEGIFLVSYDLAPIAGSLVAYELTSAVNALWLEHFSKLTFLFLVTFLILALLATTLHWQAAKTIEADNKLNLASDRFDTALEGGECGLWDWDLMADQIFWSKSMYDMLGMSSQPGFLSFQEIASRLHPQDHRLDFLIDDLLCGRRKDFDHEFRARHEDGAYIWLRARASLSQNAKPSSPHLMGIVFNITKQKELDARNQEAELRLKDAVENISEAFVLWDAESKLVLCNSKYQQFHSLPADLCQPGTPYHLVAAVAKQPLVHHQAQSERNEASGTRSMEVQLKDGRWLQINERRTKDGGFVSVGTDITVHKQQEERLTKSESELMTHVRDLQVQRMIAEETNQKLAVLAQRHSEQKTQAEAANRSKTEFLANMSHELRTPLNAIIGFSEIMGQQLFGPLGTPKYDEYASDIRKSGQFLLDVINDILDMSKIEAGKVELEHEDVQMNIMLDEALRLISPRAIENDIQIIREHKTLPVFRADKRALKQITLNLLSNAVKFTPEGGKIHIGLAHNKTSITMRIQDTGIGIPASELAKLGKPFEQVENQFTKSKGGSGLGLAISKSLVGLHDGTLEIASEEGEGTTVTVTLPLQNGVMSQAARFEAA